MTAVTDSTVPQVALDVEELELLINGLVVLDREVGLTTREYNLLSELRAEMRELKAAS